VKAYYSDHYPLPLPAGHRFPMAKYALLRDRVRAELPDVQLLDPPAADDRDLLRAHAADYVARVVANQLTPSEQRAIGFPWSPAMVERSRRSSGATLAACRRALIEGVAVNLAGGTHHAKRASGHGYCVFNDAAVATRALLAEGSVQRVAIVDLDVHQGDGTADILGGDAQVYTLSIHGQTNFPFRKCNGTRDIGLPAGTGDAEYLAALDHALARLRDEFEPQLLIYLAGADAHEGDRLGSLKLSTAGMRERDARVFALARELRIPVAVAMAGGYGRELPVTVEVHLNTVREAFAHWCACRRRVAAEQTFG
jgi:acetoin utilization deacetylase AcuC-like enzyme